MMKKRLIASSTRGFANYFTIFFFFGLFLTPSVLVAQISGTVFRDFNANGIKDNTSTFNEPIVSGITVKAYNAAGAEVGSTTSNASGAYTFTGLTLPLRIEFSGIAVGDYTAAAGSSNTSSVQFYTASSTTANFGVNYPSDYCQSNPSLVTACYVNGRPSGSGNDVMVSYSNEASGTTSVNSYLAQAQEVGSTWGIAYNKSTQIIYTAAFVKRHVSMVDNDADGKEDIGAIYAMTTSGSPALWLNLASLGVDVGLSLMPTIATRNLPTDKSQPSTDADIFDLVGKVGLGDIDISEDNTKLFVVNLYDQKVYTIDIATKQLVGSGIAVPNDCIGGNVRPFGLKYHKGKIYVGSICDAETAQDTAKMKANLFRLDGVTFTKILTFPLSYTKGTVEGGFGVQWNPWKSTFYPFVGLPDGTTPIYPQPIFADIEFDINEDLILVFNDRIGHQMGYANSGTNPSDNTSYSAEIGGDILRAALVNGTYVLESNANAGGISTAGAGNNEGPGGGEFYFEELYDPWHYETVEGGSALLPGSGQIAVNVMDPLNIFSGGTSWMNNTTGTADRRYQVFQSNPPETFGKANGLGDLEILCNNAPIEIGNRVWTDTNNNGIQDAGETGIGNVTVELYPDFDNDGAPDVLLPGSSCSSNTTATGAAVACSGTTAWTNPGNATALDATNATVVLATATTSHCLQVTGLGLNIPANATITGVTATITRNASANSKVLDNTVQLLVGGVATGTNLATATTYTTTLTAATYGGSSNLWGTTLTPAQVNAANFGINFRAGRAGTGSATARVDAIQVSVCYTTPGGANSIATTTTAATGDIGTYYFNASNVADGDPSVSGSQAGLAPHKKYLVRIGSSDWTGGIGTGDLLGLQLTTTNAVPAAGLTDVSDNDAALSATIPTIAYTTGGYGENNHTLDFGFGTAPLCTTPTITSVAADTATCTNGVANSDAAVHVSGITGLAKYAYNTDGSPLYAINATASTASSIDITSLANPSVPTTYTVRLYASDTTCYNDTTIILNPTTCAPFCTAPTGGTVTSTQATCNGATANSDASISITGIVGGDKYSYDTSGGSTATYATATAFSSGTINITGLPNPSVSTTYTVRVFNLANDCYIDLTATITPKTCIAPCPNPNCMTATVIRN